jgi:hypothetical protein
MSALSTRQLRRGAQGSWDQKVAVNVPERRRLAALMACERDDIERHCKKKKKSWKQDVYWIDAELRPHWSDRPVGTIKRRDVAQLLNAIADPPRNAPASSDHVRAIVSRLFRFGISQGIERSSTTRRTGLSAPSRRGNGTASWTRTRSSAYGASGRMNSPRWGRRSSGSSSHCGPDCAARWGSPCACCGPPSTWTPGSGPRRSSSGNGSRPTRTSIPISSRWPRWRWRSSGN